MISKHFSLSCFALENPFQPCYSHSAEMIELIDINHDVYQFRLPDYEQYEKMQASCAIKQYFRYHSVSLMLYQTNTLIVQRNGTVAAQVDNVGMFALHSTKDYVNVLLLPHVEQKQSTMSIRVMGLGLDKKEAVCVSEVKKVLLLSGTELQNYSFQKYVSESSLETGRIQHFFGHFCLLKHKEGLYSIAELVLNRDGRISDNLVKYEIHSYEIPRIQKIIGQCRSSLAILSPNNQNEKQQQKKKQKQKQKKSYVVSIIDAQQKEVIGLKGFNFQGIKLHYFLYEKFIIVLYQSFIWIYATTTGILLAKIDIAQLIQQVQEGSSSILHQVEKTQQRYCFLLDQTQSSFSQFYLMDKQKIAVFKLSIPSLIQQYIVAPIASTISALSDEKDEIHMNVMKTVNFRTKKLNTLEQYLSEGIKMLSFGHAIRFLQNQENIFVLNDGLFLFYKAVEANIQQITKQKTFIINLQKDIIQLCIKLITESKYQGHIFKGLTISNKLYIMLRTDLKVLKSNENVQLYVRLLQSKRAIRLLKQDKNRQLFELCYQLAILVKGYDYLEEIEKKK